MHGQAKLRSGPIWKIRDKRKFLIAAMTELAGDAHLSLEGDLSSTRLFQLPGASVNETAVLKRNTSWPVQEFAVLPLETDLINATIAGIGGTVPRGILHIQVEKNGRLELGLYDNFHPYACFFGARLTTEFFSRLEAENVLKQFTA